MRCATDHLCHKCAKEFLDSNLNEAVIDKISNFHKNAPNFTSAPIHTGGIKGGMRGIGGSAPLTCPPTPVKRKLIKISQDKSNVYQLNVGEQ